MINDIAIMCPVDGQGHWDTCHVDVGVVDVSSIGFQVVFKSESYFL